MEDIIDFSHHESNKPVFLNKSTKIFKIYGTMLLVALIVSAMKESSHQNFSVTIQLIITFVIGIPGLATIFLAPFGLYYCIKSYKHKETDASRRFKYTLLHSFFCLIIVGIIILLIVI